MPGLRDGLDLEALHLGAVYVARDSREPRVYDGADPGNSDRGLRHVRREDDAAARGEAERALLLAGWQ